MTMIGHDHKSEKKEWVETLYPVETIYGCFRTGRMSEHVLLIFRIRGDEHWELILDWMALGHVYSIEQRNAEVSVASCKHFYPRLILSIGKPIYWF